MKFIQQQQTPHKPLTLEERVNVVVYVCDLISMTLLPFLRKRLGYRLLNPLRWFPLCFLLFALANPLFPGAIFWIEIPQYYEVTPGQLSTYGNPDLPVVPLSPPSPRLRAGNGSGYLGIFALFAMILAARQRRARAKDIKRGIPLHSYSRGVSVFSALPFSPTTLHRLIEPVFVVVSGFCIVDMLSPALGYWLVISGLASGVVATHREKVLLNRSLDAADGIADGEWLADEMARYENYPSATRIERGDIEIIHTKLAPDVEALIARRKRFVKHTSPSSLSNARKPFQLWKRLRWFGGKALAGVRALGRSLVWFYFAVNPKPEKPLTSRQRFLRLFWHQPFWWRPARNWWNRRRGHKN